MSKVKKIVLAGLFLALSLTLPMLIGQIPQIGMALSPMHIPVLLCGFFCGYKYAAIVGFIAPLLKVAIFTMPPLYPMGISMAFELMTYGLIAGLMYMILKKNILSIYVSLIVAMLSGRIVWGIANYVLLGIQGTNFTFQAFITGAFVTSIVGIIVHIAIIPPIVIAVNKIKNK